MKLGRLLRIIAAIALLVSALVHLELYFIEGYRYAGDDMFGRSIMFNAIASAVISALLFAMHHWIVRLAGLLFAFGGLAAFSYIHTDHVLFGFESSEFGPNPAATINLIATIVVIVALAVTFLPGVTDEAETSESRTKLFGIGGAVAAVAMIGFGIYWANDSETTSAAPATPESVTIQNFSFGPADLTVNVGSTVTWTNSDQTEHSVAADDGSFVSNPLSPGSTYQFVFDKAGTFTYVCGIHPSMHGTITVNG